MAAPGLDPGVDPAIPIGESPPIEIAGSRPAMTVLRTRGIHGDA
jgi:hypothetical protein